MQEYKRTAPYFKIEHANFNLCHCRSLAKGWQLELERYIFTNSFFSISNSETVMIFSERNQVIEVIIFTKFYCAVR